MSMYPEPKAIKIPIVQVVLSRPLDGGRRELMTTWVDMRKDLKRGAIISLKSLKGKWKVESMYDDSIHDATDFDWHRKWDNNI